MKLIYKIASVSLWRKAQDKGRFDGDATAAKYFSGKDDLLLIAVDAKRLGDGLRFEPSRDGVPYPHVYFALPLDAVVFAKSLPLLPDGKHDFHWSLRMIISWI